MRALTDFIQGAIDTNTLTISSASHGTAIILNPTTIRYTPNTGYEGSDTFNVVLNCDTEPVNITVQSAPTGIANISVVEQADPYSDANIQLKINGVIPTGGTINGTGSASIVIRNGDTITFEAFSELPSAGINPQLYLYVVRNGVAVYPVTSVPATPGSGQIAGPYTVAPGDEFNAQVISTADESEESVSCGVPVTLSGGIGFPNNVFYELGAGLGSVTLTYDAINIPDKFIVYSGGAKVIDTGYVGDPSYQSALDAALAAMGLPPETISSPGTGTASFTKISTSSTTLVEIYSPLEGTNWNLTLSCPV